MARLLYVHWHEAEGAERAARLASFGYEVDLHASREGALPKELLRELPGAIVVDLRRLPSHGRAFAFVLRQSKRTRSVPLVFVEGDPEKTGRVKELLPDATFAPWGSLRRALRAALRRPVRDPVVPVSTSGYSGTPLPQKLGLRAGACLALIDAPQGFEARLGAVPDGARVRRGARGEADLALLFAGSRATLARRFAAAAGAVRAGGKLWVAWPKKASGVATDLAEDDVRARGLAAGWVDFKVCAIDATWSGLAFARRR
jgi:CheY-like chemotaxis protein